MKLDLVKHPLLRIKTKLDILVVPKNTMLEIMEIKFNLNEITKELVFGVSKFFKNREIYVYHSDLPQYMYKVMKNDEYLYIVHTAILNGVVWTVNLFFDFKEETVEQSIKCSDNDNFEKHRQKLQNFLNNTMNGEQFDRFFVNNIYSFLFRTLIYTDLSEDNVKFTSLKNNTSTGSVLKNNLVKNQTGNTLVLVGSNWNVTNYVMGVFKVSGHFRLQRCGVGLSSVKLIFIEGYFKKGYTVRSGKERYEEKELV